MLIINLEIRLANTMQGVMEYSQVTKEEALIDGVDLGLSAYYQMNPQAAISPYNIVPSKEWVKLSKKLYLFREDMGMEFGLCNLIRKPVSFPSAIAVPIYVIFPPGIVEKPLEINVMPTMADTFQS